MMKKIFTLIIVVCTSISVLMASDDKPISFEQLPANSQSFIKEHFPNIKVAYTKMDDSFFDRSYEVVLVDGSKIEFSKDGKWKEVECKYTSVPMKIIPAEILSYLEKNYPDRVVVEIEEKSRKLEIQLDNSMEIGFDRKFNVIDIDF